VFFFSFLLNSKVIFLGGNKDFLLTPNHLHIWATHPLTLRSFSWWTDRTTRYHVPLPRATAATSNAITTKRPLMLAVRHFLSYDCFTLCKPARTKSTILFLQSLTGGVGLGMKRRRRGVWFVFTQAMKTASIARTCAFADGIKVGQVPFRGNGHLFIFPF